jgi:Uma2 family endonuclease
LSRPLRRTEYERLVELGVFEGERIELLYGVLVRMSPHGPPHDSAIQRLTRLFVQSLSDRAEVRIQSAFAASDGSEPEPDVAVVPLGDYVEAHPSAALLVVEVAVSSLETDRELKARLYAECGVPEYWVVNVIDRLIEVRTDIISGTYTRMTPYAPGQSLRLLRFPDVEIHVSDVLK